ncbi:hypothetical protein WJ06_30095 [Burkholderia cepacia]|nr:hypothetical protein WJ06_30095 [Burkholderia cepacia]KVU57810.1 hypothetical protein WK70_17325 [Burkholderia cepacia]
MIVVEAAVRSFVKDMAQRDLYDLKIILFDRLRWSGRQLSEIVDLDVIDSTLLCEYASPRFN